MMGEIAAVLVAGGFIVFAWGTYQVITGTYPDRPESAVKDGGNDGA